MHRVFVFGVSFALVLGAPMSRAAPLFMGLGDLPGGEFRSGALDVSADGSVVVGASSSVACVPLPCGGEAFRWTQASGMVGLGFLPGADTSFASAVSADGSVVVGSSFVEAFRWTQASGMVGLGFLPGEEESRAEGVSADGSVVVGSSPSFDEAYRWTQAGGMVGLGTVGLDERSHARDVSADGSVVVGTSFGEFSEEAFLGTEAGLFGLGTLISGLGSSEAFAVSPDGRIVVGWSDSVSGHEAFLWTGQMNGLGDLPGGSFFSQAFGISAGGVVVGQGTTSAGQSGFIGDETNGMRELETVLTDLGLDLTGWHLSAAADISPDGLTIVGSGTNPSGQTEAWIAVIPEPGAGVLLALGLGALATRRYAAHRQPRGICKIAPPLPHGRTAPWSSAPGGSFVRDTRSSPPSLARCA